MMDTARGIAEKVRSGETSACTVIERCLEGIDAFNEDLGAFTHVVRERALKRAKALDDAKASGENLGPLAGVPFAAKNLFDIAGIATLAGSKINRARAPAETDATLILRLEAAGAILVGALNMGEYAYDFTGENAHYGPSRNPHATDRMSGGSSGGSGTAVAAGMVPLALGSDTNGSIRVPSSLCGLFGLKPTYGRLSRAGTFPFVASFDHVGPMARCVDDLALSATAMMGADPADPVCADRPETSLVPAAHSPAAHGPVTHGPADHGIDGLRIAKAGGYFERQADRQALQAVDKVCSALNADRVVGIDHAAEARAAAYLITMAEGAALHLDGLKAHHQDYDPDVRDRFLAGAMIPGAWVAKAQKFRRYFQAHMRAIFETTDILVAPATPCSAPRIGQKTFTLDGVELPVRPNLGIFTQPISFVGLPVVTVPVWLESEPLPIGVQIIAAPWKEVSALAIAQHLERQGVAKAPVAKAYAGPVQPVKCRD
ncbi:MAG: AtzE family amidohydrolase [Pseudomonadota bacterium]